jgi:DNA-binding SARP family transcriptional activator
MTFELRLLGPPAVLLDGQELMLATRKALALLAYLALNGKTPRGELADVLWSDMSEDAARNNLRKELFRLRETPLREALISTGTQLELGADWNVDAQNFLRGCGENDESVLEEYGTLLAGLELTGAARFEEWLSEQRELFAETHAKLLLVRAVRLEGFGDWRGALGARKALLSGDALQESHHREIMRLHWRLGERAAALEVFDAFSEMLRRELGLNPLPETLALLAQIQRGAVEEPAMSIASSGQLPNLLRPPLIGREAAWDWLTERSPGLSLVLGEVGVGKTRLAEDALSQPLTLRGFESAAATPLYPVAEALRARLPRLKTLEPIWRLEVARLLPELLEPGERSPESGADGRARFLEALTRALLIALEPGECVLLDDLHWFDPSSLELIAHLVRRQPELRTVATGRTLELSENAAAQNILLSLERENLLARLSLEGFGEAQTLSLLQSLSGGSARLFARRLHAATGGNPLFTLETLRGLFASGGLQIDDSGAWITDFDSDTTDYTELPIPQSVLELAFSRVTHLGAAVKRLLEVAALADEPFKADDLTQATALSEWESLEALERAVGSQVVRADASGYRFSHDVLRRSVLNQISLERGRLIHRRLADGLIKGSSTVPAHVARHLELGGREAEAVPWHVKAATAAQTIYAHSEARKHYERALEITRNPREAFRVHAALAELELTLLQLDALEAHAAQMLEIAQNLRDGTLETEARLLHAKTSLYRGQYKAALEEAQIIVNNANSDLLPEALTVLSTALIGCGQLQDAEPHLKRVLETAKPSSPLIGEAHALLKEIYRQQGQLERALEQAELARAAHKSLGKHESELTMQAQVGQILRLLGRTSEAIQTLQSSVNQARELGLERVLTVALLLLAEQQIHVEHWAEAELTINEGLLLTRDKMLSREYQLTGMLARVQQRTGHLSKALKTAHRTLEMSEQLGHSIQKAPVFSLLTEINLNLKELSQAETHLSELRNLMLEFASTAYDEHLLLLEGKLLLERGELEAVKAITEKLHGAKLLAQANYRALFNELESRLI